MFGIYGDNKTIEEVELDFLKVEFDDEGNPKFIVDKSKITPVNRLVFDEEKLAREIKQNLDYWTTRKNKYLDENFKIEISYQYIHGYMTSFLGNLPEYFSDYVIIIMKREAILIAEKKVEHISLSKRLSLKDIDFRLEKIFNDENHQQIEVTEEDEQKFKTQALLLPKKELTALVRLQEAYNKKIKAHVNHIGYPQPHRQAATTIKKYIIAFLSNTAGKFRIRLWPGKLNEELGQVFAMPLYYIPDLNGYMVKIKNVVAMKGKDWIHNLINMMKFLEKANEFELQGIFSS